MQATSNDINSGAYAKPKPPSQDGGKRTIKAPKPSQDEVANIEGLDKSAEVLYGIHRNHAHAITKSIVFRAYSDAFSQAIEETYDLSPNFLQGLANGYTPILLNNVQSPLLIASGVDDA